MRDSAIHTELLPNGNTLNIYHDDGAANPREDYDHLGTMVCFHRRYTLGDKHDHSSVSDALLSILNEHATMEQLKYIVKNTLRELSGSKVRYIIERNGAPCKNVKRARDYWYDMLVDCLEYAEIRSCDLPDNVIALPLYLYDHGGITMKTSPFSCIFDSGLVGFIYAIEGTEGMTRKQITDCLIAEVKEYDSYLTGEVYYYVVTDTDGNFVDSCGGFIGDYREIIADVIASNTITISALA